MSLNSFIYAQNEEVILVNEEKTIFKNEMNSFSMSKGKYIVYGDIIEIVPVEGTKIKVNDRETIVDKDARILLNKDGEFISGSFLKVKNPVEVPVFGRSAFIGASDSIKVEQNKVIVEVEGGIVFEPKILRKLSDKEKDVVFIFQGSEIKNSQGGIPVSKSRYHINGLLLKNQDEFYGTLKFRYVENNDNNEMQAFFDDKEVLLDGMSIDNKDGKEIPIFFDSYQNQDIKRGIFLKSASENMNREDFFKKCNGDFCQGSSSVPVSKEKIPNLKSSLRIIDDGSFRTSISKNSDYLRKIKSRGNYNFVLQAGNNGNPGIIEIKSDLDSLGLSNVYASGEYTIDLGSNSIFTGARMPDGKFSIILDDKNRLGESNNNPKPYPVNIIPVENDGSYTLNDNNKPNKIVVGQNKELIIVPLDKEISIGDYGELELSDLPPADVSSTSSKISDKIPKVVKNIYGNNIPLNTYSSSASVRIYREGAYLAGSGTIIGKDDKGYIILTADHVVDVVDSNKGDKIGFVTQNGKNGLSEIIDYDHLNDVALLRIKEIKGINLNEKELPFIPLASRDHKLSVGDKALRVGYPGAEKVCHLTECQILFSEDDWHIFTTSDPIPGESGGSLLHLYHEGNLVPYYVQVGVTQTGSPFIPGAFSAAAGYGSLESIHNLLDKHNIKLEYLIKIILSFREF